MAICTDGNGAVELLQSPYGSRRSCWHRAAAPPHASAWSARSRRALQGRGADSTSTADPEGRRKRHDAGRGRADNDRTLSADRKTVGVAVPPLKPTDKANPIRAYMDVDAATIDAMLNRLTVLRSQILPPLSARAKRNQSGSIPSEFPAGIRSESRCPHGQHASPLRLTLSKT